VTEDALSSTQHLSKPQIHVAGHINVQSKALVASFIQYFHSSVVRLFVRTTEMIKIGCVTWIWKCSEKTQSSVHIHNAMYPEKIKFTSRPHSLLPKLTPKFIVGVC
jgi:hypothetical protein